MSCAERESREGVLEIGGGGSASAQSCQDHITLTSQKCNDQLCADKLKLYSRNWAGSSMMQKV